MAETNPFANAGADAASLLAQTAEQPMTFETAKALTSKGDHDAAIDAWASLLEKAVTAHGETSKETAPLYYRYGDALLRKCEESDQLFGGDDDKEKDENELQQQSSLQVASSLAPVEDEEELVEDNNAEAKEALAEDVQVAFEVLEVSRTIYEKLDDKEGSADCWLRLGDLDKLNGRFDSAITSYESCLKLRLETEGPHARSVADVHWCLAFALECRAADKDCPNARELRDRALDNYVKCEAALKHVVSTAKEGEDMAAVKSVLDELSETIADAKARREQELARAKAPEPPKETTTIGFSTTPAASSASVMTLQPKRKKPKLTAVAPPAPPLAENGSAGSASSGASN